LLSEAVTAHNRYTRDSSLGHGCDRHLLGLRLVKRPTESHPLLEDEMFQESQRWKLSTSGLSAGDRFFGTGFGATEPDGYGINCMFLFSILSSFVKEGI
jgi:carnitine O-acetyltransferase